MTLENEVKALREKKAKKQKEAKLKAEKKKLESELDDRVSTKIFRGVNKFIKKL